MEHTRDHRTVTDAGDLLVVIPTRNNQESVGHVVQELQTVFGTATMLVIDRGSSDQTLNKAREAGAQVLDCVGKTEAQAHQAAYQYACERGYQAVAHADAQGCHPAHELSMLVEMVRQGADLVIGSRFQSHPNEHRSWPQRAALAIFRFYTDLREGQKIADPLSSMRATSMRLTQHFAKQYPSRHAQLDSITHALREGYTVRELPVITLKAPSTPDPHGPTSWRLLGYMLRCVVTWGPRRLGSSETTE